MRSSVVMAGRQDSRPERDAPGARAPPRTGFFARRRPHHAISAMLASVRADATGIPERRAFGAEIHPDDPEHRAVAALRVHLARISAPDATLPARLDSLERI